MDYYFNNSIRYSKYYSGGCEKTLWTDESWKMVTYISGGDGVVAQIVDSSNNSEHTYYVHTDHLGSVVALTEVVNNVVVVQAEFSYDAWGRMRNPDDWTDYTLSSSSMTYFRLAGRGFTGHEHLYEFEIINMNARLYDPVLGQFLSPDNYVQMPEYSQNYNRYMYAFNNPLKYTDPTGNYNIFDAIGDWINGRDIQWDNLEVKVEIGYYLGGGAGGRSNLDFTWNFESLMGSQSFKIGGDFSFGTSKYGQQMIDPYDSYSFAYSGTRTEGTQNEVNENVMVNGVFVEGLMNKLITNEMDISPEQWKFLRKKGFSPILKRNANFFDNSKPCDVILEPGTEIGRKYGLTHPDGLASYGGMRWGNSDISFASEWMTGWERPKGYMTQKQWEEFKFWEVVAHEFGHNIDYASISDFSDSGWDPYRENRAIRYVNDLRLVEVIGEKNRYPQEYDWVPWWNPIGNKFHP